jgi:hypothetical protein
MSLVKNRERGGGGWVIKNIGQISPQFCENLKNWSKISKNDAFSKNFENLMVGVSLQAS